MTEPLKPHEATAYAALVVADPEAAMRKELEDMIDGIVQRKVYDLLCRLVENGELNQLVLSAMTKRERLRMEYEFKRAKAEMHAAQRPTAPIEKAYGRHDFRDRYPL